MTPYLLDTHALIWWWLDDPKLSGTAKQAMTFDGNRIFVTPVSVYEMANKMRRQPLPGLDIPISELDFALQRDGFEQLPLVIRHARHAGQLSGDHRDPFDRLIAAQALLEDMTVITRDREIAAFGCKVLW